MPPVATRSDQFTVDMNEALITSKFWVEIDTWAQGFFRECTGLQLQTEVFEYAEGGLNGYTHKFPGRTKVGNITLKRGLVLPDQLWTWYNDVVSGKITRKSVTVHVYDNRVMAPSQAPVMSWMLEGALPVKWVGPNFKSDENATAVEQLEFACGAMTLYAGNSQPSSNGSNW
jgi:phage tail-like protein